MVWREGGEMVVMEGKLRNYDYTVCSTDLESRCSAPLFSLLRYEWN